MLVKNPFTMNDWNIKEFLIMILSVQLTVLGLVGLDFIGIHIPLLRQIMIFLYLIFVPGILILRILRIHKIGSIETVLYSVGLSITSLMIIGFLINKFYPIFGIHKPLSTLPLISTISIFVILLFIIVYFRDKTFSEYDNKLIITSSDVHKLLLLCSIPFFTVLGSYLMNNYQTNVMLILVILLICLIPLLVAFDKIPKKMYPLTVFVIGLSLLYHNSLISNYLTGYDIQIEYYFANIVYLSGYWNSNFPSNVNAILSIPVLAPIFSILCKVDLTWVLKVIYQLIFAFVPLGLYTIFKKQTNAKIGFFSCFFFVSIFGFYSLMPQLARQEIGELFIVLILMLILDKNIIKFKNRFLLVVFSFSLIVSHYTLSYIFTLILILVLFISFIFQKNIFKRFLGKNDNFQFISNQKIRFITLNFVILFIIFSLAWYIYTTNSSAFNAVVNSINNIFGGFIADFINPSSREVATIITGQTSWTRKITKYLFLISNAFIVFGIFSVLFLKVKNCNFKTDYILFSLATFVIWMMGIIIPNFATWFTGRMYQITLLILAPFFVVGVIGFLEVVFNKLFKLHWKEEYIKIVYVGLSIFLAIFLLFNSGFVYEITNDNPTSISFNSKIDSARFTEPEVLGAKWASSKTSNLIYGDNYGVLLLYEFYPKVNLFTQYTSDINTNSLIFFRELNVKGELVESGLQDPTKLNETNFIKIVNQKNKVFDDGKSFIYQ